MPRKEETTECACCRNPGSVGRPLFAEVPVAAILPEHARVAFVRQEIPVGTRLVVEEGFVSVAGIVVLKGGGPHRLLLDEG
jgi:hypothetical protein